MVQKNLPIGHKDHQNAENPRRHPGFLGHVEEFSALGAKIRAVVVSCLHDTPLAVRTMSMHEMHLKKCETGDVEMPQRNQAVDIIHISIHDRVLSKRGDPPSTVNIHYFFAYGSQTPQPF